MLMGSVLYDIARHESEVESLNGESILILEGDWHEQ